MKGKKVMFDNIINGDAITELVALKNQGVKGAVELVEIIEKIGK